MAINPCLRESARRLAMSTFPAPRARFFSVRVPFSSSYFPRRPAALPAHGWLQQTASGNRFSNRLAASILKSDNQRISVRFLSA